MYAPYRGSEIPSCLLRYPPAPIVADPGLDAAVEAVLRQWALGADGGVLSAQTLDKFSLLAGRFVRFATAHEVTRLGDVDQRIAQAFVTAHGRTRHGQTGPSAPATWHLRRSVLRMLFRTARELGLADTDPTLDLSLPPRTNMPTRPLTDDEAALVRHFAESRLERTRHAAAVALAEAGAHTGEIGHLSVADLDHGNTRVWAHGSSKTTPRWCPLDPWQTSILAQRAQRVRDTHPNHPDADLPLATSGTGSSAQLQARVCVAIGDVLTRAGLGSEPDIRPASVIAHTGAAVFAATGRIEDVALRLGLRSLDRAAALIGHDWAAGRS